MAETIDFTMVRTHTTVFLTMYRKVKIKNKQKIFETLDFTGFTSTFSQNIMFSFNGIYRETQNVTFQKISKTIEFTGI